MDESFLVLGRRVGETLTIDDHTTITILDIDGNRVKLGISGDKKVVRGPQKSQHAITKETNDL